MSVEISLTLWPLRPSFFQHLNISSICGQFIGTLPQRQSKYSKDAVWADFAVFFETQSTARDVPRVSSIQRRRFVIPVRVLHERQIF
jgi:hypothetical protein